MKSDLVVASRIHLGQSSESPPQVKLDKNVRSFADFCTASCEAALGIIAVDATEKIKGYDLVESVKEACAKAQPDCSTQIRVVAVTPWGRFVPALNALISKACQAESCDKILFVSLETTAPKDAIDLLQSHLLTDTLVVGGALPGHDFQKKDGALPLNGRTTPWNTISVWNLQKLALTGFLLVSEGHLTEEPSFGVEEVAAISCLQRLLGASLAKAKLINLPNVEWNVGNFEDPDRRKWHSDKMKSKIDRAERQTKLLGFEGEVFHC